MEICFTKMHGCGNDFILINHRNKFLKEDTMKEFVKTVCKRKFHIGADGLILLENSKCADFRMRYFNADGTEGEMCGNGARCVAKFAYLKKLVKREMTFETLDGIYDAKIIDDNKVQITFPSLFINHNRLDELSIEGETVYNVTVGVPHAVLFKDHVFKIDKESYLSLSRKIRYNDNLFPKGTNVNVVEKINQNHLTVRTYERGVEEETFACGSGATASAIIATLLKKTEAPVQVKTKGGMLSIHFVTSEDKIDNITLTGEAIVVCKGIFKYPL